MGYVGFSTDLDQLEQQIVDDEDLRLKMYKCPAGKWTIGAGRNIEERGISKDEAILMLKNDIRAVMNELAERMNAMGIDPKIGNMNRSMVLVNMGYNLGVPSLMKFEKMWAAIKAEDWETAADEMRDSKWYRQVGKRGERLAEQMRTGEWQS